MEGLSDARVGRHLAPPTLHSPYAIRRARVTIPVSQTTSNTFGQRTVLLFGEFMTAASLAQPDAITGVVCVRGTGTNVPGVTEDATTDPQIVALGSNGAFGRLHKITVTVTCTTGPLGVSGSFYLGTMPGNIRRGANPPFTSWNELAAQLLPRKQMVQYTAYSATQRPIVCTSAPQDCVGWGTHSLVVLEPSVSAVDSRHMTDNLFPIVLVLEPTAAAVEYTVTVNTEWRLVYTMADAQSSTHQTFPSATEREIGEVVSEVTASGGTGLVEAVANAALAAGAGALTSAAVGRTRSRRDRGGFF